MTEDLINKLKKNHRHLKKWRKQGNIQCFRLYEWDIPQYPLMVDCYHHFWQISLFADDIAPEVIQALETTLNALSENGAAPCLFKARFRSGPTNQYTKLGQRKERQLVEEGPFVFSINGHDYLDTGLFFDKRGLRKKIAKSRPAQASPNFLNLFSYTCTMGVAAAFAGFHTVNVDLSKNYLQWGESNYQHNGLNSLDHQFIRSCGIQYLKRETRKFEMIFIDPPSFSNSKAMDITLDIQRDHRQIIELAMKRLRPDGVLYFMTNKRKFRLDQSLFEEKKWRVSDLDSFRPKDCPRSAFKLFQIKNI